MKNGEVQKLLAQHPDDTEVVVFVQGSSARPARPVLIASGDGRENKGHIIVGDRYLAEGESPAEGEVLKIAFYRG